jgi:creatinine amidohydrolase
MLADDLNEHLDTDVEITPEIIASRVLEVFIDQAYEDSAATKLRNRTGAFIAIVDPFYIADQVGRRIRRSEPGGVGHADEMETSHMMFLHPELCNMENAIKNIHEKHPFLNHDPYVPGDRVFVPSDVATYREGSLNIGVVGDPTASTKENGEIYHKVLIANLVEFIRYCEEEVKVNLRNQEIPL